MMNKQTAVDWLVEELAKQNMFMYLFAKEIKQAKKMEKEQIINARIDGDENHTFNSQMRESYANDYYKETYAKNS